MGIISGLFSMFGWGIADFLAAKSSRKIGAVVTLLWMQLIGLSFAFIYYLLAVKSFDGVAPFLWVLLVVGFFQTIAYLSFYKGLKEGMISLVSPIGASWAVITVFLSIVFLKETPGLLQIAGIMAIIFGTVLVSINIHEIIKGRRLQLFGGAKEGLVAMAGFGISMFLIVPAARELGWFLPVFLIRFFTAFFLVLLILFTGRSFKTSFHLPIVALLLPMGLLDIGAMFFYGFGVLGAYASVVAPITAAFPLVTVILARIFLKEKIMMWQGFGIAGIISGLILLAV